MLDILLLKKLLNWKNKKPILHTWLFFVKKIKIFYVFSILFFENLKLNYPLKKTFFSEIIMVSFLLLPLSLSLFNHSFITYFCLKSLETQYFLKFEIIYFIFFYFYNKKYRLCISKPFHYFEFGFFSLLYFQKFNSKKIYKIYLIFLIS